jgi:hypothetical protein
MALLPFHLFWRTGHWLQSRYVLWREMALTSELEAPAKQLLDRTRVRIPFWILQLEVKTKWRPCLFHKLTNEETCCNWLLTKASCCIYHHNLTSVSVSRCWLACSPGVMRNDYITEGSNVYYSPYTIRSTRASYWPDCNYRYCLLKISSLTS